VRGETREGTRGNGRVVVEVAGGITVYPARGLGDRWRAVWYEGGRRRQAQAVSEERLAARLAKVGERLAADAGNMERLGAELIAYFLSPDRLPPERQWSRKHAHTQRRLCERFVAPVIATLVCEDIKTAHMQAVVNAAPTAQEGKRLHALVSALVGAGITGGYLANPRLKEVHWQANSRPPLAARPGVAGESVLFVDPAEIPAHTDVAKLGQALAATPVRGELYELMANLAAYTGLRWGELAALTAAQIDQATRVITVDRKVVEIGGRLYEETPKNRKKRRTIYPRQTPEGYPLAEMAAARMKEATAEQEAGANPLGLMFPSPKGKHWRASNFSRRVLQPAYLAAGWRGASCSGRPWTWHSLRHVFCTTALFTWGIDATDVSRLAGHANYRITLDLYVGTTAGTLDRARTATE
jgi:integrase